MRIADSLIRRPHAGQSPASVANVACLEAAIVERERLGLEVFEEQLAVVGALEAAADQLAHLGAVEARSVAQ